MIEAIIFDMDGVLIDSEILKARAWGKTLENYTKSGYDFYMRSFGPSDFVIAEKALKEFNFNADPQEIASKWNESYHELLKLDLQPIKSSIEFLKSISRKYKIGLASSEERKTIDNNLKRLNIDNYFHSIVSGKDEAKNNKPDPEIYLIMSKKIGSKPPQCLAIEDSPAGIESAKSAGMYCIGFRNNYNITRDLSKSDIITDNLMNINLDILNL